jgi:hypothetical protein
MLWTMSVHRELAHLPPVRRTPDRQREIVIEIVAGVTQEDCVRFHGAVVAALEVYPPDQAIANVFAPALHLVGAGLGFARRDELAAVIRDHVASFDTSTPAPAAPR